MIYMFCKHRVADFDTWHNIFKANSGAAKEAGLHLLYLLRDTADPNLLVYLFAVDDVAKAKAFTETPEAGKSGEEAGIIGPFELLYLTD